MGEIFSFTNISLVFCISINTFMLIQFIKEIKRQNKIKREEGEK